ncbi:MAG: hypothetical protein ACRDL1_04675 [Solirubrobacterales bacterium]
MPGGTELDSPPLMLRHGRALGATLLGGGLIALAVLGAPQAEAKGTEVGAGTLNLYVGADLVDAVLAPDVPALEAAAGRIYEDVLASDPRARLKIQAKLIKQQKPDLLGLQEVETLYRGPQGRSRAGHGDVIRRREASPEGASQARDPV